MSSPTRTGRNESPSPKFSFAVPRRAISLDQLLRTYVVNWIRYDKTTRKRQWSYPGEAPKPTPKPDIHRN